MELLDRAYLSIYNVGVPGANAYEMANVITPARTTITVAAGATPNQNLVTLSPAFQFAWGSPGKRVYLVSGPVTYLCDTAAGTLSRYSGYSIASSQPLGAAALARGRCRRRPRAPTSPAASSRTPPAPHNATRLRRSRCNSRAAARRSSCCNQVQLVNATVTAARAPPAASRSCRRCS